MSSQIDRSEAEELLSNVSWQSLTTVAREVLRDQRAVCTETPTLSEITTSHNDQRTIGIVKVSGAATIDGSSQQWSSVVKIIDPSIDEGEAATWVSIEVEQQVYEQKLFSSSDDLLRPAMLYLVESDAAGRRFLWLEDLTAATQPPWNIENYSVAAYHLGAFNGRYRDEVSRLPFSVPADMYFNRWGVNTFENDAAIVIEQRETQRIQDAYKYTSVESGSEFASLANQILARAKNVPHGLSFGDSHARNMFPNTQQTIGIDWAGLGNDPIGVDVGVLIGSGMTFGINEALMVVDHEQNIFDSYVEGLRYSGWDGDLTAVRIGFFGQFAGYLAMMSATGRLVDYEGDRRAWIEKRFGVPLEEIPSQLAPAIAQLPKYIDEIKQLLD